MAGRPITDWYGRNDIGWGKVYETSEAGNVNEVNKWGYIYPFNIDGSVFTADTIVVRTDNNVYKADRTEF